MRKIRKGDIVQVVSGNDKGKRGEVMSVLSDKNRLIVKGVNITTRHQRPTARQREGGIIEREGTIHMSNVMVICPSTDQPTRVGFKFDDDGSKRRISRASGVELD